MVRSKTQLTNAQEAFRNRIAKLINEADSGQDGRNQVAQAIDAGIDKSLLTKYKYGESLNPNLKTLVSLAETYGVSIDYLVGRTDYKLVYHSAENADAVATVAELTGLSDAAAKQLTEFKQTGGQVYTDAMSAVLQDLKLVRGIAAKLIKGEAKEQITAPFETYPHSLYDEITDDNQLFAEILSMDAGTFERFICDLYSIDIDFLKGEIPQNLAEVIDTAKRFIDFISPAFEESTEMPIGFLDALALSREDEKVVQREKLEKLYNSNAAFADLLDAQIRSFSKSSSDN